MLGQGLVTERAIAVIKDYVNDFMETADESADDEATDSEESD